MIGFVPLWLVFLASGTMMALLALLWGVRARQFEDQERARFIPLADLTAEELAAEVPAHRAAGRYGLLAILLGGALTIAAALVVVLRHS